MNGTVITVFDIAHPFCALLSLTAFAYKMRDLRDDPQNLSLRGLCFARLFTGVGYLVLTPALYVRIDEFAGVADLSTLLGHSCVVLSALSSHLMVLGWFNDPRASRRKVPWVCAGYGVALTVMIVLFARAPRSGEHPVDFEVYFATRDAAAAYIIVFLGTYGLNLANTARRTWPPSCAIDRPWLSRSLRMTALGSLFVMGFLLGKLVGVIGRWCGTDRLDMAAVVCGPLLANLGTMVIVGSHTFPGWGRGMMVRVRQHRSLRRLYPMWFALYRADPGLVLFPPRSARPPLWVRDVRTHLYRLIIEIRDGQRALRPYLDEAAVDLTRETARGAGLRQVDLDVTQEACLLALGVQRKRRGADCVDWTGGPGLSSSGTDLATELAWLERVADAFAHSPVVTAVLAADSRVPGAMRSDGRDRGA